MLITTSREPGSRTRSFVNELVSTIPVFIKYNRGKATLRELYDIALSNKASYVLVVYEKKGNPSLLKVYYVDIIKQVLDEVFDIVLKGVTLYREKMGRKPKPFNGKYCIIYADGMELLADLINRLTGYSFCLEENKEFIHRYINIYSVNQLVIIGFYDQMRSVAGPIIRVRKIVDKSGNKSG